MARTIDNLGVDISNRYAEDRELFDESLLKDARTVTSQISITTTTPSHPSEFDTLFDLGKRQATWANFYAPPQYYASRRRLFAEQIIPQIGTPDKQETQLQRIEAVGNLEKTRHTLPTEIEQVEQEKQTLVKLLSSLNTLDQLIVAINGSRLQYHKG